jgi:hypothetical protein
MLKSRGPIAIDPGPKLKKEEEDLHE